MMLKGNIAHDIAQCSLSCIPSDDARCSLSYSTWIQEACCLLSFKFPSSE